MLHVSVVRTILSHLKLYIFVRVCFKVMYLNARERSVLSKHVTYIDESNRIYKICCCWRQHVCQF